MKCKIIPEKCIACGLCQIYAPQTFDYTNEGIVLFKSNENIYETVIEPSKQTEVLQAYRKCPVGAILIEKN